MKHAGRNTLILLVAVAAMTATGCDNLKEENLALKNQNDMLLAQNKDLQDQVGLLGTENEKLKNDLDTKSLDLAAKNERISELQSQLAGTPKRPIVITEGPVVVEGWEKGRFGDKISVGSDLLFSSGRATLTRSGKSKLSQIANDIKQGYAGLPVRVYGYTDSDPIRKTKNLWADNLDLSANRAMAVTRYLTSRGLAKDQIETVAMGDTNYISSNATKAGKAKNRRVEIVVIKSK